jgi:protein-disulfide isomerase
MVNRILVLVVAVALSIFLGVTIVTQQTNNPVIAQLIQQQSQILDLQRKIERQLADNAAALKDTATVQEKIGSLEKKIDELASAVKGPRPSAPMVPPQLPPEEDFTKVYNIPVAPSTIKGKKEAPALIVGFLDLQCPFSARFQPVIEGVLAAYPDKVKYIIKHFPLSFHVMAKPAAKAVLAAGEQGKYWEMCDLILANNRDLNDAKFEEFAKTLRLNIKKFKTDYEDKDGKWETLIQNDFALGQKVDVRGTPSYYLNGRKTMARDVESLKAEIDKVLSEKK